MRFEKHPKAVSGALRDRFRAREVFGSFEKRTPGHFNCLLINLEFTIKLMRFRNPYRSSSTPVEIKDLKLLFALSIFPSILILHFCLLSNDDNARADIVTARGYCQPLQEL